MAFSLKARSTVRKAALLASLSLMLAMAFIASMPESHALSNQVTGAWANGLTVNAAFVAPVVAGDTIIVIGTYSTASGSAALTCAGISDNRSDSFTFITSVVSGNGPVIAQVACYAIAAHSGGLFVTATASTGTAGLAGVGGIDTSNSEGAYNYFVSGTPDQINFFGQCGQKLGTGANSGCTVSSSALSVVQINTATSAFTLGFNGTQVQNSGAANNAGIYGSGTGTYTYNANNPVYAIINVVPLGAGGCTVYACQTSTYSITWSNATCVPGSSGTCTMTTTWTIIHYDSTTTNVTVIYCDNQPGCAHYTQNTTKVQTYTDTSVSVVTSHTTVTTTQTAVVAPTTTSLLYWFMGFAMLIVPPASFVGVARRGNPAADIELPMMVGLFIGALLALLVQVVVAGIGFAVMALVIVYFWRRGK